jgi:hypothetical protein
LVTSLRSHNRRNDLDVASIEPWCAWRESSVVVKEPRGFHCFHRFPASSCRNVSSNCNANISGQSPSLHNEQRRRCQSICSNNSSHVRSGGRSIISETSAQGSSRSHRTPSHHIAPACRRYEEAYVCNGKTGCRRVPSNGHTPFDRLV